jgi:hypothetical protein
MTRRTLSASLWPRCFQRHRHIAMGTSPTATPWLFHAGPHLGLALRALPRFGEKVTVSTETDICEPLRQSTDSRADRSLPASRSPKRQLAASITVS